MSTAGTARGTICRTIIAFATSVFAAAFGGVALAAWEATLSLLAAKWAAQVQTPTTDGWESDAEGPPDARVDSRKKFSPSD